MAQNNLLKLKQISGGLQLQTNLGALTEKVNGLTASQIATNIVDPSNGDATLNVAQVLTSVMATNTTQDDNLKNLKSSLDTLNDIKIDDYVKITGSVVVGGDAESGYTYTATLDTDVAENDIFANYLTQDCTLYTDNNTVIVNNKGVPVKINLTTKALSDTSLCVADVENTEAESLTYKPITLGFNFKIFAKATRKLGSIEQNFLLDNDEMKVVYYQTAIDELAFKLSKNTSLLETVKELIGQKSVSDALSDLKTEITNEYKAADTTLKNELNESIINVYTRIKNSELDINKLNGADTEEGSVAKSIKDAVDPIKTNVSTNAEDIENLTTTLNSTVSTVNEQTTAIEKLNADSSTEGSVDYKIKNSITSTSKTHTDVELDLSDTSSSTFAITVQEGYAITDDKTTVVVNNLVYVENVCYTLDRSNKTLTWDSKKAGFELDSEDIAYIDMYVAKA